MPHVCGEHAKSLPWNYDNRLDNQIVIIPIVMQRTASIMCGVSVKNKHVKVSLSSIITNKIRAKSHK